MKEQKSTLNHENVHEKATDYLSMPYSSRVTADHLLLKQFFSLQIQCGRCVLDWLECKMPYAVIPMKQSKNVIVFYESLPLELITFSTNFQTF